MGTHYVRPGSWSSLTRCRDRELRRQLEVTSSAFSRYLPSKDFTRDSRPARTCAPGPQARRHIGSSTGKRATKTVKQVERRAKGICGARSRIYPNLVRAHRTRAKVHQSIGWTDLSVTNFAISSSKKECWLASNSLRDTFALTRPMVLPFKNSTDLIEI